MLHFKGRFVSFDMHVRICVCTFPLALLLTSPSGFLMQLEFLAQIFPLVFPYRDNISSSTRSDDEDPKPRRRVRQVADSDDEDAVSRTQSSPSTITVAEGVANRTMPAITEITYQPEKPLPPTLTPPKARSARSAVTVEEFHVGDEIDAKIKTNEDSGQHEWFPGLVIAKDGSGRHAKYRCTFAGQDTETVGVFVLCQRVPDKQRGLGVRQRKGFSTDAAARHPKFRPSDTISPLFWAPSI